MTPDGKPFYQIMIGSGGGPNENFDGVYSKDFPLDRGKVTDLYHDSDPTHGHSLSLLLRRGQRRRRFALGESVWVH